MDPKQPDDDSRGITLTCNGCKHFQPGFEQCAALMGQMFCSKCDRQWKLADRHGCPKCSELRGKLDLSECPKGFPSRACPGRVEEVKPHEQMALF